MVAEAKFFFFKQKFSPLIWFSVGYLFALSKGEEREQFSPYGKNSYTYRELSCPIINVEIGFRVLNSNRVGLICSISHCSYLGMPIKQTLKSYDNAGVVRNDTMNLSKTTYGLLGLNVGITF